MTGLIRAEWIRFRKRRSLQVIVLAVPLLAAFLFFAGYSAIGPEPPPFDAAAVRAELIAQGYGLGLPPDQLEKELDAAVEAQRFPVDQAREQNRLQRSAFVYPQSLVTLLGSGTFVLFALILLVATTIGDEFGWGTIRTTLLASSHRVRLLAVRLAAIVTIAIALLASLALLGVLLPLVLAVVGAQPPATPALGMGALAVLVVGTLEAALLVIAFGAVATLVVRSGSLTLVVLLVYVAIEGSVQAVLQRFTAFQEHGAAAWVLDAFPVRGIAVLTETAGRVASGVPRFPGEEVPNDLGVVAVPMVAFLIWAAVFLVAAFRRFSRMDIVE